MKNRQISHICRKKHKSTVTTDDSIIKYAHKGLGRRVQKIVSATTSLFMYDEGGQLLGEYDSAGGALYETVYLDEQPVAVLKPAVSTSGYKAYYIYADHLNTPRLITDNAAGSTNRAVWQWDSDPFGITQPNENPAAAGVFTYNPRFPGQVYDKETGLHYNYFRDYNPGTGRYVQPDPIGLAGGMNTFGYVDGNPLSKTDSRGLFDDALPLPIVLPTLTGICLANPLACAGAGGFVVGTLINPIVQPIISNIIEACTPLPDKKNCEALRQSILNTCYGLTGRKRMACFEAANTAYRQCMGFE